MVLNLFWIDSDHIFNDTSSKDNVKKAAHFVH